MLDYALEIEEAKHNTVTPRWPVWNEVLYESPFIGQFYMIYDAQKQLVSCGGMYDLCVKSRIVADCFFMISVFIVWFWHSSDLQCNCSSRVLILCPVLYGTDAYADRTSISLPKGHYTIRLQVKHEDATLLEAYESTPMLLERKLDSSVKVPCYASQADALMSSAVSTIPLFLGTSCSVIFGEPSASSLPTSVHAGDVFHGKVTYLKKPANMLGNGTRPGGYPVTFFCTGAKPAKPAASKDKDSGGATSPSSTSASASASASATSTAVVTMNTEAGGEVDSSSEEKTAVFEMDNTLREAIRDAKLKYLSGLGAKEVSSDVISKDLSQHPFHLAYANMVLEYPEHVPLRLSGLEYLMKCATTCTTTTTTSSTLSSSPAVVMDNGDTEEKMNEGNTTTTSASASASASASESGGDVTAAAGSQIYLQAAVQLADEIFGMIDKSAIMSELGVLIDSNDSAATKQRKDIKAIREQVCDYYIVFLFALFYFLFCEEF